MSTYFDPRFEQESIDTGIEFQQQETGVSFLWFFWDPQRSRISNIYDEDLPGSGRRWKGPITLPVFQVTRTEGALEDTGQGAYTVDSIRAVCGYRQATNAGLVPAVDRSASHLKDRFIFDGLIWAPSSIVARNLLGGGGTRATITITATQERDDEMVNDAQFQKYAERRLPQPDPGYLQG